ncbi:MAG: hypothetical protein P8L78_19750 [Mariniblastus sp.]|nr:hypothetical protein [Mariniblastus sp.]MDG2183936.1 hypothetical protein [Mariniblastus sp.]
MPLSLQTKAFVWILKAFVVLVFLQSAVPVEGQCLRRRRVPTLDFPTNIPMWEIYGLNPYAPIKVQSIPFTPLQVSNYASVRVAKSVEILGDREKAIESEIQEQVVGDAIREGLATNSEIESLKRELGQAQAMADENLKRAKRAELKIAKSEAESKGRSQGKSKGGATEAPAMSSARGASKGRRSAKRGTAALKQELARIEKLTKQQEERATQKIAREFQKKIESVMKTGKSNSDSAVKSLGRERDEAVAQAVKRIQEKSKKRISEIQKELSARARS